MYAILAFVPILTTIISMTFLNFPAKRSLFIAWLVCSVIAIIFWKTTVLTILATTLYGFLSSLDVLLIIFGAIIIMNTLKKSGGMYTINKTFTSISEDSRIQAIVIGFLFVSFLEGAAGFGTPAALAAPLLVSLGMPPLAAATITLFFDSVSVPTGAVGTPIVMSLSLLEGIENIGSIVSWTVFANAISSVFIPFIGMLYLMKVFGKEKSFKKAFEVLPFSLFTGIVFGTSYVLVYLLFSFEFAALIGSLISLPIVIFAAKKKILTPKTVYKFSESTQGRVIDTLENKNISSIRAWLPYVIIAIILMVTRIDALGIKDFLKQDLFTITFKNILGYSELTYRFNWGYLPGTIFIIVALITTLIHKMDKHSIIDSWKITFKQVSGATIALLFGVAFVQVFRYSNINNSGLPSMLMSMAGALSKVGGVLYVFIAPFIGALGSFISGSSTVSNVLFTTLQYEVASAVNVLPEAILALQIVGGGIGTAICVNSAVAVSATLGTIGEEGKLIKLNIIPVLVYLFLLIAIVGIGILLFA